MDILRVHLVVNLLQSGKEAQLETLMNPKNAKKGDFSNDIFLLFDDALVECGEVMDELIKMPIRYDKLRLECADVCNYLYKIIQICDENITENIQNRVKNPVVNL